MKNPMETEFINLTASLDTASVKNSLNGLERATKSTANNMSTQFRHSFAETESLSAKMIGRMSESQRKNIGLSTKLIEASSSKMVQGLSRAIIHGDNLADSFKKIALNISDMALTSALKPLENVLSGGLNNLLGGGGSQGAGIFDQLFQGLTSGLSNTGQSGGFGLGGLMSSLLGNILPFAKGGVVGAPTYFPMQGANIGLMGEAGPEAIMPLRRGSDGRLGVVAQQSGTSPQIIFNVSSPNLDSFKRSESQITTMLNRAVQRGARGL